MSVRHIKKFIVSNKAEPVHFFVDDNSRHEVQDWAVEIGICNFNNRVTNIIGKLTLSDLIRLRRVVNRAIKIVSNPKNHVTNDRKSYLL